MDDMEKLGKLIPHWAEHNVEHARTYAEWAQKAEAGGKAELSRVLGRIAEETRKMDALFAEAGGLV